MIAPVAGPAVVPPLVTQPADRATEMLIGIAIIFALVIVVGAIGIVVERRRGRRGAAGRDRGSEP